ncbi:hypothetical protein ACOTC5_31500 [Achromobacter xylosoxidans]
MAKRKDQSRDTIEQREKHMECECFMIEALQVESCATMPKLVRLGRVRDLQGLLAQVAALVMAHATEKCFISPEEMPSLTRGELQSHYLGMGFRRSSNTSTDILKLTSLMRDNEYWDDFAKRTGPLAMLGRDALSQTNARAQAGWFSLTTLIMGSNPYVGEESLQRNLNALHLRLLDALAWARGLAMEPDNSDELSHFTQVLTKARHLVVVESVTVDAMFKA